MKGNMKSKDDEISALKDSIILMENRVNDVFKLLETKKEVEVEKKLMIDNIGVSEFEK